MLSRAGMFTAFETLPRVWLAKRGYRYDSSPLCILLLTTVGSVMKWLITNSCASRKLQCTLWRWVLCYMTYRTGSTVIQKVPAELQCR